VESISLESKFSRNITLKTPLVSSPMDTVTEHKAAIEMALNGGIGVVHHNMSAAEQVAEVIKVKKFKNGFITDPKCLSPEASLADVDNVKAEFGFSGIPITVDGKVGSKLVGLVCNRDGDFVADRSTKLSEIMNTELVTATEPCTLEQANQILHSSKKGKLPIVNQTGELVALISREDVVKARQFPLVSKDLKSKQLLVAAAIGTRPDDRVRAAALIEAGVDAIVIDSSQGDSHYQVPTPAYSTFDYEFGDCIHNFA
jgi:IMP dehydrogenase